MNAAQCDLFFNRTIPSLPAESATRPLFFSAFSRLHCQEVCNSAEQERQTATLALTGSAASLQTDLTAAHRRRLLCEAVSKQGNKCACAANRRKPAGRLSSHPVAANPPSSASVNVMLGPVAVKAADTQPAPWDVHTDARAAAFLGIVWPAKSPVVLYSL